MATDENRVRDAQAYTRWLAIVFVKACAVVAIFWMGMYIAAKILNAAN